jgi:catechol 2,3-dioxygenase-like lactoylglutathione lyase family enzyme
MKLAWGLALFVCMHAALRGQLAAPGDSGVAMGHLHLNSKDSEGQARFWTEVLGAKRGKLANGDFFKLPGVLVMLWASEPSGPSEGSVVNHVGLKVRDLAAMLTRAEVAKVEIVSRTARQVMLVAPGGLRVELTEDPGAAAAVENHHIHFYTAEVEKMRQWYVETFGAKPGKRGKFEAADLPGVNLSFTPADSPLAGTKGRALDHIGFEVKGLEAFVKKLEAKGVKFDVAYRRLPALNLAVAFFTDPWGTYIELTEGLNRI